MGAGAVPVRALSVARADQGVTLTDGANLRVDLVEHLLAAFGGLGVRRGALVLVEGPEVPLLDGGARHFTDAIIRAELPRAEPEFAVTRAAEIRVGESTYRFAPGSAVAIDVEVAFDHPAIGVDRASWEGDADDFLRRIAPARTFGFARDAEGLRARGRAIGLDLEAVIVFTGRGVLAGCRPPEPNEIARHKLLDLVGDWACYGGPPLGRVRALRPGHARTHEAVRRALDEGIVAPR